jgi:protein phosphatase
VDDVIATRAALGRVMPKNDPTEDGILAMELNDGGWVAAIADGVGGRQHGEIASRSVLDIVQKFFARDPKVPIETVFHAASDRIKQEDVHFPGLATTLTIVRARPDLRIDVGHVGDCRAYHLRGFGIVTITEDQNEAELLRRKGILTEKEAARYPRRNILTSALSSAADYELFINSRIGEPGDRIVLMSDGAYSVVHKRELAELNARMTTLAGFYEALIRELGGRPRDDDASVVCLEIESQPRTATRQ